MSCQLCPRLCNIDRSVTSGVCGAKGDKIVVSKSMLHMWEEPCISGGNGSGAIFFSGCSLRCVYCQNRDISHQMLGKEYTPGELGDEMLRLQAMGADNINLVTPTHYSDKIREAINLVRDRLRIPVIYNTSGYELRSEILKMRGYVDVFLIDIKYFSPEYSFKYSGVKDYYSVARDALCAMLELCPQVELDEKGLIKKGVILRHLVLPSLRKDSINILRDIKSALDVSKFKLSLMAQYTPEFCPEQYKEIKRRLTTFEYESVVNEAIALGYDGYTQELGSSTKDYTPKFTE
ncbi:MAG: radical SAM protein [Clostridia bacterium]|nr:radical SAM protein [Clostridia bacterium]